jgi:hypothetical protein
VFEFEMTVMAELFCEKAGHVTSSTGTSSGLHAVTSARGKSKPHCRPSRTAEHSRCMFHRTQWASSDLVT